MEDIRLEALMTDDEVAALLGRSVKTLANWRAAGLGPPCVRNPDTGRFLGYRLDELAAWMRQGEEDDDE